MLYSLTLAVSVILIYLSAEILRFYTSLKFDRSVAAQHGCGQAPKLKNRWPFGIDRLIQIWTADYENRLMDLFRYHSHANKTIEQRFLGARAFGTIDPRNLECLLTSEEFGFGLRSQIFSPLLGDGISTQEGEKWKHSRGLISPHLRQQILDPRLIRHHVNEMLQQMDSHDDDIDLQPLFFQLTLRVTTEFLFGVSMNRLGENKSPKSWVHLAEFGEKFDVAQNYVVQRFRLLNFYWLKGGRVFQDACNTVHSFVDEIIRTHGESETPDGDEKARCNFLDTVLRDPSIQTSDKAIRDQLVNLLLAGRDTTACLLTWTFFLLTRHNEALIALREEISQVMDGRTELNPEDFKKMRYLRNVLRETLRLYPPVPLNTRTARQTTVLPVGGGPNGSLPVLIRKGENVAFCVYALHRLKELYGDDADAFRPERWDDTSLPIFQSPKTKEWGYLPFGNGPRASLGRNFALFQSSYVIVRILQKYSQIKLLNPPTKRGWSVWSSDQGEVQVAHEEQKMTLVLSLKNCCRVSLQKTDNV